MSFSFRSALLIFSALSAGSVAPAQVGSVSEPLVALTSTSIPSLIMPQPLFNVDDPAIQPAIEIEPEVTEPARPAVRASGDLDSMVAELRSSDPSSRELECLAVGIYFESKSEPLIGQLAVGEVIANRADSKGRFPSSYCGVLFQKKQFSFVRGKSYPKVARGSRQWQNAVAIAKIVDQDLKDSAADKALFFHARRVSPRWKLKRVASIGNHIFYR